MKESLPISIMGHVHIEDDQGNVLLDRKNAVHPQNMARVIARALSNEDNEFIHRIAFGNGGTVVDPTGLVNFKTPNDGLSPDLQEWRSRLYNETYTEIVDDRDTEIGFGEGANPSGDPATVPDISGPGVRSQELGVISQVVIASVINPTEPTGQISSDLDPNPGSSGDAIEDTEGSFVFDELGLYTTGLGPTDSNGIHRVDVGDKTAQDDTGLISGTLYDFTYDIAAGTPVTTSVTPVGTGVGSPSVVTYADLVDALNGVLPSGVNGVVASITDNEVIPAVNTFGFLQFTTNTSGSSATIEVDNTGSLPLFTALGQATPTTNNVPVDGEDAGVQNNASDSGTERERLLTHVIFSPVTKTANRTIAITYTLTVSVARST
jgi:hypothetical protein